MDQNQSIIDNLNYEKIALDQSLVVSLQQALELRKQILFKDKVIRDLTDQINTLLAEKNSVMSDAVKCQEPEPVSGQEPVQEVAPIIE